MRIAALAGGVGAAKFLSGLVEVVAPRDVTVVVNTGDDFEWHGLYVCPDLDTVVYTLAGLAHPETGWGVRGDTFQALGRLEELGCEAWFRIGDRDLATHVYRTERLRAGASLSEVTRALASRNRVAATVLPMRTTWRTARPGRSGWSSSSAGVTARRRWASARRPRRPGRASCRSCRRRPPSSTCGRFPDPSCSRPPRRPRSAG